MTLTDDAKAVVALTTRLGTRNRPSLTARMWHQFARALEDAGHRPADVFDRSFDPASVPGVDSELSQRVIELLSDGASATFEVDNLRHKGIWTLTFTDDEYPHRLGARLGESAPPVLFGIGDRSLMAGPGIGVVGSRDVTEEGKAVAEEVARKTVSLGRSVVSGGARGVDQLAMNAGYSEGGSVIGVLADSLIGRIRKPDVLDALDSGRTCLVSQQTPSSGFTPAAAMSRNKIIYALAEATVVVASTEESGGTWAGATEALKNRYGAVLVWRGAGEGPGNAALERAGAIPVTTVDALGSHLAAEDSEQLSLDLPR